MKYSLFISSLAFLLLSLFVFVPQSLAQSGVTRVRGNVYDYNNGGAGIGGLTVSVTCNGITKSDVTDSSGLYGVDYTAAECDKFTPVSSVVTFNSQTQSQTVFVSHVNTATLDYYYGAIGAPEFGAIGGVVAAFGSAVTFLGLKRKYLP